MTAPDSVERVVAEMRIPHEGGWDNDDVAALADRLQVLARGPQQAGGEDVVQAAARIASEAACLRIDNERLQAEVARLRETTPLADVELIVGERDDTVLTIRTTVGDIRKYREAGRDAERYRWLRDKAPDTWDVSRWLDKDTQEIHLQDDLDAAIDAARLVRDGDSGEG